MVTFSVVTAGELALLESLRLLFELGKAGSDLLCVVDLIAGVELQELRINGLDGAVERDLFARPDIDLPLRFGHLEALGQNRQVLGLANSVVLEE